MSVSSEASFSDSGNAGPKTPNVQNPEFILKMLQPASWQRIAQINLKQLYFKYLFLVTFVTPTC